MPHRWAEGAVSTQLQRVLIIRVFFGFSRRGTVFAGASRRRAGAARMPGGTGRKSSDWRTEARLADRGPALRRAVSAPRGAGPKQRCQPRDAPGAAGRAAYEGARRGAD